MAKTLKKVSMNTTVLSLLNILMTYNAWSSVELNILGVLLNCFRLTNLMKIHLHPQSFRIKSLSFLIGISRNLSVDTLPQLFVNIFTKSFEVDQSS